RLTLSAQGYQAMRAAIFKGAGRPVAIENIPDPKPGEGQVLVKVGRCGVCGTDVHQTSEHSNALPVGSRFGHEYCGEIVEIGRGVGNTLKVGDTVAVMPVAGCGKCLPCQSGSPMRCCAGTQQVYGFAEYA